MAVDNFMMPSNIDFLFIYYAQADVNYCTLLVCQPSSVGKGSSKLTNFYYLYLNSFFMVIIGVRTK